MNLPNKLTMARICLIPIFMVLVQWQFSYHFFVAAVVFAVASFTDFLDGHIARKRGIVTDFGKFADPLADKILTTTAIIYLVAMQFCHPAVLVIVVAREFAVSGLRMVAASSSESVVIAANIWGKVKTVLQMVSIIVIYTLIGVLEMSKPMYVSTVTFLSHGLMWLVAAVTLISGLQYLWQNRHFINTTK